MQQVQSEKWRQIEHAVEMHQRWIVQKKKKKPSGQLEVGRGVHKIVLIIICDCIAPARIVRNNQNAKASLPHLLVIVRHNNSCERDMFTHRIVWFIGHHDSLGVYRDRPAHFPTAPLNALAQPAHTKCPDKLVTDYSCRFDYFPFVYSIISKLSRFIFRKIRKSFQSSHHQFVSTDSCCFCGVYNDGNIQRARWLWFDLFLNQFLLDFFSLPKRKNERRRKNSTGEPKYCF